MSLSQFCYADPFAKKPLQSPNSFTTLLFILHLPSLKFAHSLSLSLSLTPPAKVKKKIICFQHLPRGGAAEPQTASKIAFSIPQMLHLSEI